jgi:phage-related protein
MTTFTYTPDFPAEERSQPRIRGYEANGFTLRVEDGINLLTDKWPLTFSARNSTDRTNLLSFFATQNGTTPFTWVTPFNETAQFICTTWDLTLDSCHLTTISAEFQLVYVPGQTNIAVSNVPSTAFTWIPDFTTSRNLDSKARRSEYGDGYGQSVTFGINAETEKWSLVLNNLTNSQRDAIRAFLRGAARTPSFEWQNPLGETGDYICDAWTTTFNKFNNSSIRADFTRVYGTFLVSFAGYAPGFNAIISYDFAGGFAYPSAPGINATIEADFTAGIASAPAPGISVIIDADFTGGVGYTDTPSPPPTGADSSASFWSDWAYYDPDIFLYAQAAAETPVYWNRWQSWTEDPPLLFEESS